MLLDYYSSMAIRIQKRWRGFFVRKYVHNFYARKRYLEQIVHKNAVIRDRLEEYNQQTKQEIAKQLQELRERRVAEEAKKKHFLLSTNQIPGVYNSPYRIYPHEMEFFMKTTKFPVEPHTRQKRESKTLELPPIKKVQGPFRSYNEVIQQREKPLNPTLRVATSFFTLEAAREQMRADEAVARVHDDVFLPFQRFRYPYQRLLHSASEYGHIDPNYLRTVEPEKHVSDKDFKRVLSPIPVFEKFGQTYSKGADAVF
jgi:hypothetical protein